MTNEMLRVYIIALTGAGLLLCGVPDRPAYAQLSVPDVTRTLPDLRNLEIRERTRRKLEDTVDKAVPDTTDGPVLPLAEQLLQQVDATVERVTREFVGGVDARGHEIELGTVVVLVETAKVTQLDHAGVTLLSRRDLSSLGLTILTLRKPARGALPTLIDDLRTKWPDAVVDFNHLYRGSASQLDAAQESSSLAADVADVPLGALRIGVIDSAVQPQHVMLRESRIVTADFAMHEGERPLTHGTAVASLIVSSSGNSAVIFSAGVFFQQPGYAPGATTDGLVAAIDWLVASQVPVINMSLAGPPNDLLHVVLQRAAEKGHIVVAAVGNNGPSGEPLFPGAYESVIGVTAVDYRKKVFRYANRGNHVDFAARGVDVRVADSNSGGLRIESGTSMAAPHVAVVIAALLHSGDADAEGVRSSLIADAEDLGRRGFDPVYGFGLVTRPPVMVSAD